MPDPKDDPEPDGSDATSAADAARARALDAKLDEGLRETFPASDPVAVSPRPA